MNTHRKKSVKTPLFEMPKPSAINPGYLRALFDALHLPTPEFEFQFYPTRRWRFDIAFPAQKVFVEVQGGIWTNGRHVRGAALLKEWEKLNTAAACGWRGIFVQPKDVTSTEFLTILTQAIHYTNTNASTYANTLV